MYHSITFGNKNTWDDWFLIPSSRPVFNPPKLKSTYIDIPGADGHLDVSEAIAGRPVYECRTGSLEFIVDNWHKPWHETYSDIMDYLHGRTMRAILEDDPAYYYEGRFTINAWTSEPNNSKITIDYVVSPYKMELTSSLEDWYWDSFNFETGIIRDYKNILVHGVATVEIRGSRKPVVPRFIVKSLDGSGVVVEYGGVEYVLPDGASNITGLMIEDRDVIFTFYGLGSVSIDYRGGRL